MSAVARMGHLPQDHDQIRDQDVTGRSSTIGTDERSTPWRAATNGDGSDMSDGLGPGSRGE